MRVYGIVAAAIGLALLTCSTLPADHKTESQNPHRGSAYLSGGNAIRAHREQAHAAHSNVPHGHSHGGIGMGAYRFGSYRSFNFGVGYPSYFNYGYTPYGFDSCYYSSPYGTYYNPQANYVEYYLPPVYFPAELAYGPQAMKRFMGLPSDVGTRPLISGPIVLDASDTAKDIGPRLRMSNLETLRSARRLVERGDDLFRRQRYHEALQQYKSASRVAPDLADAHFRQGHALVATRRFDLAVDSFKRGLAIDPGFIEEPFKLDEIYGDARVAKQLHIETLADESLADPSNSDLFFLLGVLLHFDGEPERAVKFFFRAATLAGRDDEHVRAFLPEGAAREGTKVVAGAGSDT